MEHPACCSVVGVDLLGGHLFGSIRVIPDKLASHCHALPEHFVVTCGLDMSSVSNAVLPA